MFQDKAAQMSPLHNFLVRKNKISCTGVSKDDDLRHRGPGSPLDVAANVIHGKCFSRGFSRVLSEYYVFC